MSHGFHFAYTVDTWSSKKVRRITLLPLYRCKEFNPYWHHLWHSFGLCRWQQFISQAAHRSHFFLWISLSFLSVISLTWAFEYKNRDLLGGRSIVFYWIAFVILRKFGPSNYDLSFISVVRSFVKLFSPSVAYMKLWPNCIYTCFAELLNKSFLIQYRVYTIILTSAGNKFKYACVTEKASVYACTYVSVCLELSDHLLAQR